MTRQPRYKNLDLPQLRSFVLVAAEGSYAAAARALSISTPVVWEQVRCLAHAGQNLARVMPDRHVRPFDAALDPLPIVLISRRGRHLAPAMHEFRRTLRAHFADPVNHEPPARQEALSRPHADQPGHSLAAVELQTKRFFL